MLKVVDEADGVPAGQEGGNGVALVVADFQGEQAVGFEGGLGLGDEAAIDIEPGGAREERGGGFVVADLGMEGVAIGGGDVGRVGDYGVEVVPFSALPGMRLGWGRQVVQKVGLKEADAAGEVVAGGVGCGNLEGGGRDVSRGDVGVG